MTERPSAEKIHVTRRIAVALLVAFLGSLGGAAAVAGGSLDLSISWVRGQLLIAAGLVGVTVTGLAACFILAEAGRLPSGLTARSWLGLPKYIWIVGSAGLLFAVSSGALALLPGAMQ